MLTYLEYHTSAKGKDGKMRWTVEKVERGGAGVWQNFSPYLAIRRFCSYCQGVKDLPYSPKNEEGWRRYFDHKLEGLWALPEGSDNWSAHKPSARTMKAAQVVAANISRDDMPVPLIAAGSDGTIQMKWRRASERELSFFVEADAAIEYLLVRNGKVYDGEIEELGQINRYVNLFLD